MTSRRGHRRVRPSEERSFLRAETRSVRVACQAGVSPNRIAEKMETPAENSTTLQSIAIFVSSAKSTGGLRLEIRSTAQNAPSSPRAPPMTDSVNVSSSSWRINNPRLAPIASRTAISFFRSAACASSRLARLTHTTRSNRPATATRIVENPMTPPRRMSPAQPGSTSLSFRPSLIFGHSSASLAVNASNSVLACGPLTPRFKRARMNVFSVFRSSM